MGATEIHLHESADLEHTASPELSGQTMLLLHQVYKNPEIATDPIFRSRIKSQLETTPEILREAIEHPESTREMSFRSRVLEILSGSTPPNVSQTAEKDLSATNTSPASEPPVKDPLLLSAGIFIIGDNDPLVARMKAHLNVWIDKHNLETPDHPLQRYELNSTFRETDLEALKAFQVAHNADLRAADPPTGTGSPGPSTLTELGKYLLSSEQEKQLQELGAGSALTGVEHIAENSSGPEVLEAKARLVTFLKREAGGYDNYKNEIHISDTAETLLFNKLNQLQRARGLAERDSFGREELVALMEYKPDVVFIQDYQNIVEEHARELARAARQQRTAQQKNANTADVGSNANSDPSPGYNQQESKGRDQTRERITSALNTAGETAANIAETVAGVANRAMNYVTWGRHKIGF